MTRAAVHPRVWEGIAETLWGDGEAEAREADRELTIAREGRRRSRRRARAGEHFSLSAGCSRPSEVSRGDSSPTLPGANARPFSHSERAELKP